MLFNWEQGGGMMIFSFICIAIEIIHKELLLSKIQDKVAECSIVYGQTLTKIPIGKPKK